MTDFDMDNLTDEERAWIAGEGSLDELPILADKRAFGNDCKQYNEYTRFMTEARNYHQEEPASTQAAEAS